MTVRRYTACFSRLVRSSFLRILSGCFFDRFAQTGSVSIVNPAVPIFQKMTQETPTPSSETLCQKLWKRHKIDGQILLPAVLNMHSAPNTCTQSLHSCDYVCENGQNRYCNAHPSIFSAQKLCSVHLKTTHASVKFLLHLCSSIQNFLLHLENPAQNTRKFCVHIFLYDSNGYVYMTIRT